MDVVVSNTVVVINIKDKIEKPEQAFQRFFPYLRAIVPCVTNTWVNGTYTDERRVRRAEQYFDKIYGRVIGKEAPVILQFNAAGRLMSLRRDAAKIDMRVAKLATRKNMGPAQMVGDTLTTISLPALTLVPSEIITIDQVRTVKPAIDRMIAGASEEAIARREQPGAMLELDFGQNKQQPIRFTFPLLALTATGFGSGSS